MGCFHSLLNRITKPADRSAPYAMPLESEASPSPSPSPAGDKYKGGAIGSDSVGQAGAYKGGALGSGTTTKPGAYKGGAIGSDSAPAAKPGAYKGGALGSDTAGAYGGGALGSDSATTGKPGAYKGGALGSDTAKPGAYKGGALGSDGGKPGAYKGGALGSDAVATSKPGAYKGGALGSGTAKPGAYKGGALGSDAAPVGQLGSQGGGSAAPRLDPADYMFKDLKGAVRVKLPGSVAGQQFIIENCVDCDLYVLDYSAMVTIDDCVNCRIFVGPVESSIFIRDCSGCKCVFICRQYRTRGCKALDTSMLCATRPIIETSSSMRFGCFDWHYTGLAQQMAAVGMSPYANFWGHIFDFTKASPPNFSFLPPDVTAESLLSPIPAEVSQAACLERTPNWAPLALVTWGDRPTPSTERCFLVFQGHKADAAREVIGLLPPHVVLLRANAAKVPLSSATAVVDACPEAAPGTAARLAASRFARDPRNDWPLPAAPSIPLVPSAAVGGAPGAGLKCIMLELCGPGCMDIARALGPQHGAALISNDMDAYAEFRYLGVEG